MAAPTSKGGSLPLVRTSLLSTPSPKGLRPLTPPVAGCPRLQSYTKLNANVNNYIFK